MSRGEANCDLHCFPGSRLISKKDSEVHPTQGLSAPFLAIADSSKFFRALGGIARKGPLCNRKLLNTNELLEEFGQCQWH